MNKLMTSALVASLMASTAVFAQSPTPPTTEQTPPAASESPVPPASPAPAERMTPPPSDDSAAAPSASPSVSSSDQAVLTEDQVKGWINKVVYSSDNKNLGEVAALARDSSGKVTELHADIGGFLGLGETRVRVMPSDFTLANDRVILKITADQAKSLPKLPKS